MAKPGKTGIKRIIDATEYSIKGLKSGLKTEAAMRQELLLAGILTILSFFIAGSMAQLLILIILPWFVFIVEILNSAIEAVVDRISDEYHELSGKAKDLGSAAVFVSLALTAVVWLISIVDFIKNL